MDCEPGGLGHINGQELHTAFHQVRDEGDGSGKPVEFGDEERRFFPAAEIERLLKLWPLRALAALHFEKGAGELTSHPLNVPENCLSLRIQSKTGAALPVGGNAVIGDE